MKSGKGEKVQSKNTHGENAFREVLVRCMRCGCKETIDMQCGTGRHFWDCTFCGEKTNHLVKEVSPMGEPVSGNSSTWPIVLEFAKRLEAKLEKNLHKGNREGWLNDEIDELLERLMEEVGELDTAICLARRDVAEWEKKLKKAWK